MAGWTGGGKGCCTGRGIYGGVRRQDDGGGRGNDDVVVGHDAREEGDVIDDDRRERAGPGDVVVPDALLEGP